jgi:conjugative transposon TraN protein
MNRLCMVCMLLLCLSGYSQTPIPSYSLSVTFQKTTNIIFPYRIEKADIGSSDVIGHKDVKLGNVLFLKANRKGFVPTNLSVYTSDGKFYSFIIQYRDAPDTLNLSFVKDQKLEITLVDSFMEARLDSDATQILDQASFLHRKTKSQEMKAVLTGIYIKDHLLWFVIDVSNGSQIDYQPEYIKFFIRDKHTNKRTAIQETELSPVWRTPDKPVAGNEASTYIFSFPVFTLSRPKKLVIQMDEKNGGRTLILTIPSKALLKSRVIQ